MDPFGRTSLDVSLARPEWLTAAAFRQPVRRRTYLVLVASVVVATISPLVAGGHRVGQAIGIAIVGAVALVAVKLACVAGTVADLVAEEQRRGRTQQRQVRTTVPAEIDAELLSIRERIADLEMARSVPDRDISRLEARCVVLQDRLDSLTDRVADTAR